MSSAAYYQLPLDAGAVPDAAGVYATLAADTSSKLRANESCALLAPVPSSTAFTNCRFPRTCRSCLEKSGCLVHPSGLCSDPHTSDFLDLTNYFFADSTQLTRPDRQRWYFPAESTAYCADSDAACVACRANPMFTAANDSRFCVGKGGCVCISNCIDETALRVGKVTLVCSSSPLSTAGSTSGNDGMGVVVQIMIVLVGTLVILASLLIIRLSRMARDRRVREAELAQLRMEAQQACVERRNKSAQLGVGELQLAGWRSHREAINIVEVPFVQIHDATAEREEGVATGIVPRELLPVTQA